MDALEPGTMVIMVKNEDGTFSPIAMNEDQSRVLNAFTINSQRFSTATL